MAVIVLQKNYLEFPKYDLEFSENYLEFPEFNIEFAKYKIEFPKYKWEILGKWSECESSQ